MDKLFSAGKRLLVGESLFMTAFTNIGDFVGGIKNTIFGGEGLFFATIKGPGTVWIQSLPVSRLAGRMMAYANNGKEEGSVLGGLGRMFDGDNR